MQLHTLDCMAQEISAHEMSAQTPAGILTRILVSLHSTCQEKDSSTYASSRELPDGIRSYILTLHLLYPHLLLDALDLLDRGLVTRLCVYNGDRDLQFKRDNDTAMTDADAELQDVGMAHRNEIVDEMEASDVQLRAQAENTASQSQRPQQPQNASRGSPAAETLMPDNTQSEDPEVLQEKTAGTPSPLRSATSFTPHSITYHVSSAQVPSYNQTRASTSSSTGPSPPNFKPSPRQIYQVHLKAWHCSCPGFAHAAFAQPSPSTADVHATSALRTIPLQSETSAPSAVLPDLVQFGWGGLPAQKLRVPGQTLSGGSAAEQVPPCCKHLMASVLAEVAGAVFARGVVRTDDGEEMEQGGKKGVIEKWVSKPEAAGWAVGIV